MLNRRQILSGLGTTALAAMMPGALWAASIKPDFCVAWSAIDARKAGFETYVTEDACRDIDAQGSLAKAWNDMDKAGIKRIQSGETSRSSL